MLQFFLACAMHSQWKTSHDRADLAESASSYWTYVRWGDAGKASLFLDSAAQRTQLATFCADPPWRITDVVVVSAEVGEPFSKEEHPITRDGTVIVRMEHYDERIGRVEVSTLTQHWLKTSGHWQVDPTPWEEGPIW